MLSAVLRLLTITVGTLVATGLLLLLVRWAGLHQNHTAPSHPWFDIAEWKFRQPTREEACSKKGEIPAENIAWLKVRFADEQWYVACEGPPISVAEKITASEQKNWLIEVGAIDLGPLDKLIEDLSALDKKKNFAVYSSSQRVARYLRKKSPQWLFAADAASLVRLHLFASFGIETILEFWPDFVLQFPADKTTRLSPREVQELERRQKRVIVLPNQDQ